MSLTKEQQQKIVSDRRGMGLAPSCSQFVIIVNCKLHATDDVRCNWKDAIGVGAYSSQLQKKNQVVYSTCSISIVATCVGAVMRLYLQFKNIPINTDVSL